MQEHNHSIKDWAKDDRPREKLLSKNPMSVSNAELIAILLNNGSRHRSALDLARELLLLGRNNLMELGKLSAYEFMKVKGVGKAKAVILAAALELGRRRQASTAVEFPIVKHSSDVARYLQQMLQDLRQEVFVVLFLNRANRIRHTEIISTGGITATIADPRIILKKALEHEAVSLILSHNHPSGSTRPSKADEELTIKIRDGARLLDIKLLDHIIIGQDAFFSFADQGLI
ncbi:RadC family protein [Flavihumibacter solisilvae]|jgi:DNA repair protein RadC|uniref:MPN domain-containing protein n=1 Tax=Flavihumibacter solisilvae TaxID=1349421 RepID=A0A0C1KZR9_9BACT|nr:DNA repair protein RadC [Flavihumibacter solisilvae]KIC93217.1 hypothetical protein OI18_18355 [Flavihumibacter solisilvae]